jgi:hypothetical protein
LENIKQREPLGRLKHRREDTIKMDYKEIGWQGMDWIHLPRDRNKVQAVVNMIVNIWFHKIMGIS